MTLWARLQSWRRPPAAPPSVLEPPSQMTGLRDSVLSGWFNQDTSELFTGFPVGQGDIVADIGCGLGGHAQFCARQGAKLLLVDSDPRRVEQAAAKITALPGHTPFERYVSDCNPLPIADAVATKIVCSEVLEHVDSPEALLAEIARIGRPGALYLLACPDPRSEALQQPIAQPSYFQKPNHVHIIQHDAFARYVQDAGLEILSRHSFGFFWSIWLALFWSSGSNADELGENSFQLPGHPVLDNWLRTWQSLLDQPNGIKIKHALDEVLPKSQVIIARKPG
jgi:ubiquinone/menaquinone biosynthesis C-methylase UbiE